MKTLKQLAFAATIAALCAGSALANTTSTVADANTRQSSASGNYGASTYIAVEYGSQLRDAWFKFNTSSIKSGFDSLYGVGRWKVSSVAFNGYSWEAWNYKAAGTFKLSYNNNDAWTEGGITWGNQPTGSQVLVSNWSYSAPGNPSPCLQTINLGVANSGLVNDILAGDYVTMHMQSNGSDGASQVAWESKEFSGGAYAAYLDIAATAVPEPGSVLALATGFIGLVGFAARRRNYRSIP